MNAIEIAQKVATEHQALLFRARKDEPGQYDVKELYSGNKKGWTILDGFSASAIVTVYKALNEVNQAKFGALPLEKMAAVAFKLVK